MVKALICIIVATLMATNVSPPNNHDKLLDAIEMVESAGRGEATPDGDNGRAKGPFQIHKVYWTDAVAHDKTLGGTYDDCRRSAYARKVVLAYWDRYAPQDASDEVLARIHNGGPKGHKKKSTLSYWNKIQKYLTK